MLSSHKIFLMYATINLVAVFVNAHIFLYLERFWVFGTKTPYKPWIISPFGLQYRRRRK